jgi:hypothetical protein
MPVLLSPPTIKEQRYFVNEFITQYTSGPHTQEDKSINLGEAAHIKAARKGQARYDPEMTDDERANINNGIWLCKECARKIDLDEKKYTVSLLNEWKTKHEKYILNGKPSESLSTVNGSHSAEGIGNVTGLDIQGPAIIMPGTKSSATGIGNIIATRIGNKKEEE